jgi:methylglutamate dehydrogenase subunit D
MLKSRSALEGIAKFETVGLALCEAADFQLTQYAGEEKFLKKALGKLPAVFGLAQDNLLRISPTQIWEILPPARHSREGGNLVGVYVTLLSSSRARILIEGEKSTDLLKACAAVDFANLDSGEFVMTGIHHVPVLVHCIGNNKFHLYVMRTFALSIWEWLVDAAPGLN